MDVIVSKPSCSMSSRSEVCPWASRAATSPISGISSKERSVQRAPKAALHIPDPRIRRLLAIVYYSRSIHALLHP